MRARVVDRRGFVVRGAIAAVASLLPPHALAALESDEGVVVLPSTARRLEGDRVELRVQAWVYERDGRRLAARALAKLIGLDFDEIDPLDRSRFVERTKLFAREAQARRTLRLQVKAGAKEGASGETPWLELPASRRDGGIDAAVPLPPGAVGRGVPEAIDFELMAGARRFPGRAYVAGPEGLSIVSDIDDTIKHTQVRDRRQMLLNTFARPFAGVPGMAHWYAQIAQAAPRETGQAASFHFVSSAPWALASALEGFLHDHAFPAGSLHLRAFSLQPQALMSKTASSAHKHATIERLLADQPRRRFVLVGDSGEQDPEIYGAITRRHRDRIAAILVRDVTGERTDAARYRAAFDGVPNDRWALFDDPEGLPRSWA